MNRPASRPALVSPHPTRLYLIRHGEVEDRYHRIFGGKIDMDLSPRGYEQAEQTARYLSRFPLQAVYSSSMKRARQTAAPLADLQKTVPIVMPEIREVDFGEWTGLRWEEVNARYQLQTYQWVDQLAQGRIPGGETGAEFAERIGGACRRILQEQPGKEIAVVCHGGVIRMFLSILLNVPFTNSGVFEIEYASVSIVIIKPEHTQLELHNLAPWRDLP